MASRFGAGTQRFVPGRTPGSGGDGPSTASMPLPRPAPPTVRPTPPVARRLPPSTETTSSGMRMGGGLGKGKGAAGLGTRGMLKRHHKVQRDTIKGITKGDIRRLARRGGIKRISSTVYDDIREALRERLRKIMQNITAIVESDPSNRKTVVVQDVIFTLNRLGTPIYGFDATFDGKVRKG